LNYMKQQGVAISNGLERIQGRLSATHKALDNRMRLGVNVTTSRVNDQYILFENRAGFEGGVFQNAANFNPTQPVMANDTTYYEPGGNSLRNPVALANQVTNLGQAKGFVTDALLYNSLNAAGTLQDSSDAIENRLVSFLSRVNYGYKDRFFVTGVLRYDGSSKFAEGHKWALFPGLSASWHLSQ